MDNALRSPSLGRPDPNSTPGIELRAPTFPGQAVYMGQDFGLTPAAIFGQNLRGQWLLQRELVATSMGAKAFAEDLKRFLALHYPGSDLIAYGDPSGDFRAQTDETTPFMVFKAAGIQIRPAPSNRRQPSSPG